MLNFIASGVACLMKSLKRTLWLVTLMYLCINIICLNYDKRFGNPSSCCLGHGELGYTEEIEMEKVLQLFEPWEALPACTGGVLSGFCEGSEFTKQEGNAEERRVDGTGSPWIHMYLFKSVTHCLIPYNWFVIFCEEADKALIQCAQLGFE